MVFQELTGLHPNESGDPRNMIELSICTYVCVCICMYVYVYICMYLYVYVYTCVYVYMDIHHILIYFTSF